MDDDPIAKFNRLTEIVNEKLKPLGLTLVTFGVIAQHPEEPASEPMVQGMWLLDPDIAFKTVEERQIDAQLKDIEINERALETQEKTKEKLREAVQDYKNLDDVLKGIDPND